MKRKLIIRYIPLGVLLLLVWINDDSRDTPENK